MEGQFWFFVWFRGTKQHPALQHGHCARCLAHPHAVDDECTPSVGRMCDDDRNWRRLRATSHAKAIPGPHEFVQGPRCAPTCQLMDFRPQTLFSLWTLYSSLTNSSTRSGVWLALEDAAPERSQGGASCWSTSSTSFSVMEMIHTPCSAAPLPPEPECSMIPMPALS